MDKRIIMLWCNRKNTHLKDMNDLGKNYDKKIFIKKIFLRPISFCFPILQICITSLNIFVIQRNRLFRNRI